MEELNELIIILKHMAENTCNEVEIRPLHNKLLSIKEELTKQLSIAAVSQQRELLNFLVKRNYLEADEHWVEEMLLEYNFEKIL